MNLVTRVQSVFFAGTVLLVLSSCGDSAAPASGNGDKGKSSASQNSAAAGADTTADYVLRAEEAWIKKDRAEATDMYNKAILAATKEGNTVQAQIFTKRLAEIENAK